jgi:hypothetical protein
MPVTLALKTCPTCGNGFVDNPAACPFFSSPPITASLICSTSFSISFIDAWIFLISNSSSLSSCSVFSASFFSPFIPLISIVSPIKYETNNPDANRIIVTIIIFVGS